MQVMTGNGIETLTREQLAAKFDRLDGAFAVAMAAGPRRPRAAAAPDAPVITEPADGSVISEVTPTVTGTGDPGDSVEVTVDGDVIDTVDVGEEGDWELALTDELDAGEHEISATQTDAAGSVSPAAKVTFEVDPEAPAVDWDAAKVTAWAKTHPNQAAALVDQVSQSKTDALLNEWADGVRASGAPRSVPTPAVGKVPSSTAALLEEWANGGR